MKRPARSRRGFFAYEFLVGMALIGAAAVVLFVATTRSSVASTRFAQSRAATRAAEAALANLQSGRAPAANDPRIRIDYAPLQPQPNAAEGWQWVIVSATIEGQTRRLSGLVPAPIPQPQTRPAPGGETR